MKSKKQLAVEALVVWFVIFFVLEVVLVWLDGSNQAWFSNGIRNTTWIVLIILFTLINIFYDPKKNEENHGKVNNAPQDNNEIDQQPETVVEYIASDNRSSNMSGREKILYANVDWFTVPDELEIDSLPQELTKVRELWNANSEKSSPEICKAVEKYITCQYLAENMSGWEDYFPDNNYGEFTACKVNVVGVEFSAGVLPSVRAEAWIKVSILENVTDEDLEEWAESEWGLQSGIMWSWNLEVDDDVDLAMEENSGLEAYWVEEIPK